MEIIQCLKNPETDGWFNSGSGRSDMSIIFLKLRLFPVCALISGNMRVAAVRIIRLSVVLISVFFLAVSAEGHDGNDNLRFIDIKNTIKSDSGYDPGIGVDEKNGNKIALDALFTDEHGRPVTPRNFIDRPVIILPVFYYCTQTCGTMLGSLATVLNSVPLVPGRDYRVMALSIDHDDDSESAMRARNNYLKLLKKEFPPDDWLFLTGDLVNIRAFTDSMGFRFRRVSKHNYVHPNVMLIVSKDGTIIRYMYGPTFLPFDIGMALTEATSGIPSISVRKVLSYCFTYDPDRKTYTLTIVRYIVISMLGIIGLTLFMLIRKKTAD